MQPTSGPSVDRASRSNRKQRILNNELADIFPGNSHMAGIMRGRNWADMPFGEPQDWPDALKIPLRMLLTSRFEMWLGW